MADERLRASVTTALSVEDGRTYSELAADPLATWIETAFGLDTESGSDRLVRRKPTTVTAAAQALAVSTGASEVDGRKAIRSILMVGSRAKDPHIGPLCWTQLVTCAVGLSPFIVHQGERQPPAHTSMQALLRRLMCLDLRQTVGPFAPFVTQHGARSIGRPSIRPIGSWPRPGDGCARTGPPTVCGRKRGLLVWHLQWG